MFTCLQISEIQFMKHPLRNRDGNLRTFCKLFSTQRKDSFHRAICLHYPLSPFRTNTFN